MFLIMRLKIDMNLFYYIILIINLFQICATLSLPKKWALLNMTSVSSNDNNEPIKNIVFTDSALYSLYSPVYTVYGQLIQVQSYETSLNDSIINQTINNLGCSNYINQKLPDNYIALVSRGVCTFDEKVRIAKANKASAIVIYNNDLDIITMYIRNSSIPNVMVSEYVGNLFKKFLKYSIVYVSIKPGSIEYIQNTNLPSRSSIYFVAFAFLSVILVTFIWLTVYYVQKFRYLNTKKRLDDKLKKATLKALSKMVVRKISNEDKELTETCAICLENYQANDLIRQLPCGHYFHQKDVDVWLMEHRNCPMCKINILQACGIEFKSPESALRRYLNNLGIRRIFRNQSRVETNNEIIQNSNNPELNLQTISVDNFLVNQNRPELSTEETVVTNDSEISTTETDQNSSEETNHNQQIIMVTSVTSNEQIKPIHSRENNEVIV